AIRRTHRRPERRPSDPGANIDRRLPGLARPGAEFAADEAPAGNRRLPPRGKAHPGAAERLGRLVRHQAHSDLSCEPQVSIPAPAISLVSSEGIERGSKPMDAAAA